MRYYRHKEKKDVVCERENNKLVRFGKWVWEGKFCSEVYTYKKVTKEFFDAFEEITQEEFNDVWGNKLQQA